MGDYYDRDEDRRYVRAYKEHTPDLLASYAAFSGAVFAEEGREIPKKYRELMAVAVSVSKQCVYCMEAHTEAAVKAGATDAELAEAAWVASAIGAGAAYTHGRLPLKFSAHRHG